jgi:hypothetical protein
MQRQMERGDVAEAQQRLGIRPHGFEVDQVEIAQRQPAAGQREDRSDFGIPQQTIELLGHLCGRGHRPPPPPVQVDQWRHADLEPHLLDRLDAAPEQRRLTLLQPAGQGRHRNDIARPHPFRTQDRWHPEPSVLGNRRCSPGSSETV